LNILVQMKIFGLTFLLYWFLSRTLNIRYYDLRFNKIMTKEIIRYNGLIFVFTFFATVTIALK